MFYFQVQTDSLKYLNFRRKAFTLFTFIQGDSVKRFYIPKGDSLVHTMKNI